MQSILFPFWDELGVTSSEESAGSWEKVEKMERVVWMEEEGEKGILERAVRVDKVARDFGNVNCLALPNVGHPIRACVIHIHTAPQGRTDSFILF